MKVLLDTHTFIWFILGSSRLGTRAEQIMRRTEAELLLSTASLLEMTIKISLGKLQLEQPLETLIPEQLERNRIQVLPILFGHLVTLSKLEHHHRDPFDRLIIAQAIAEELPVIGVDPAFDAYPVQRIW